MGTAAGVVEPVQPAPLEADGLTEAPAVQQISTQAPPKSGFMGFLERTESALARVWFFLSYYLNFEWLKLGKWPSNILLVAILLGLSLAVGLTANTVKNNVKLGVEFGGGYQIVYTCVQKANGTAVTPESLQSQAAAMFDICAAKGEPNSQVVVLKPNKIQVIIPGVTDVKAIAPILNAFNNQPLGLVTRSAQVMSGNLGKSDLKSTCLAAGVAMAIVWFILVLRYRMAGLLGLWLCIVFIWLVIIFFNQSTYALSEAGIVAVVLNIGLSADAHVIAFERVREDLHALPRGTDPSVGLATMHNALAIALITVLEANITTLLAMVVLWGVGTGPTIEFAFTVLISVCVSILINILMARFIMRLGWNAGWIATGGFFGDKGPVYDEEEKEKNKKMALLLDLPLPYWVPKRRVPFDYVRFWWFGAIATLACIIGGAVCLGTEGMNWGVDYTAGTDVQMHIPPPYDYTCANIIKWCQTENGNVTVSRCTIASKGNVDLKFSQALSPQQLTKTIIRLELFTSAPIVYNSYAIDPSLAKEQSRQAIIALVVSAVVVAVFLFLRFGIFYALAGLVSMVSAGIFSIMCFAMGQYVVNLPFVSAVLTVFAYAVNDCVVVFDRIRFEVARMIDHNCPVDLKNTVNRALSLVTIRSLLTLLTVMICSICLIIIGPSSLMPFSLAITFGLLNATYTTLLICSPLWYFLHWVVLRSRNKAGGGSKAGAEAGAAAAGTGGDATPLKGSSFQSKGSDDPIVQS